MVREIPFNLGELYIQTKIHHDTVSKILEDKKPLVLHKMYNIVNEVNERQDFLELTDKSKYYMIAAITTVTALKGAAKEQYTALKLKNKKSLGTPHYRIRVIITEKETGKDVFDFTYRTSRSEKVFDQVPKLVNKINTLLWKKD